MKSVFSESSTSHDNFLDAYKKLAEDVLNAPEVVVRGQKTKELVGYTFSIRDTTQIFDLKKKNRFNYLFAEILWYAAGSYDIDFITKFASFWSTIANVNGTVNSNYGERIFRQKASSSFFRAFYQLLRDQNTRQSIVHINLPEDINEFSKDIPCTLTLQFFIRNNALHLLTSMRSSDLWKGITYDIPNFYVFLHTMHHFLKSVYPTLKIGEYKHISGSLHIYEPNYKNLDEFLSQDHTLIPFKLTEPLVTLTGQPTKSIKKLYAEVEDSEKYDFEKFYKKYFTSM